jgi:hypothetical protein
LAGLVQVECDYDPGRSQADGADIQLAADAHEGLASLADPVTQPERSSTVAIIMDSAATILFLGSGCASHPSQ